MGLAWAGPSSDVRVPAWLPRRWVRVVIPLTVAAGLWFGHAWAWWGALVLCGVLVFMNGMGGVVLIRGGFFRGEGAWFKRMHYGLSLGTELGVLALLFAGQ